MILDARRVLGRQRRTEQRGEIDHALVLLGQRCEVRELVLAGERLLAAHPQRDVVRVEHEILCDADGLGCEGCERTDVERSGE